MTDTRPHIFRLLYLWCYSTDFGFQIWKITAKGVCTFYLIMPSSSDRQFSHYLLKTGLRDRKLRFWRWSIHMKIGSIGFLSSTINEKMILKSVSTFYLIILALLDKLFIHYRLKTGLCDRKLWFGQNALITT